MHVVRSVSYTHLDVYKRQLQGEFEVVIMVEVLIEEMVGSD